MTGFVEHYPHPFHPLGPDGHPDTSRTVEVFQLRPGDQQRLADWSGLVGYPGADGGLLLLDGDLAVGQLALGDFAVRSGPGLAGLRVERADGFAQRYVPAE